MASQTPQRTGQSSFDQRYDEFFDRLSHHLNDFLWRYRLELALLVMVAGIIFAASLAGVVPIGLVVAAMVGLLVAGPSRRLLGRQLRGARRRRQWETRVAPTLGWKTAGQAPELLEWDETSERVVVRFRPLPAQGPRAWPDMADAFRRYLRGSSSQWRESHGVLAVVVSLRPLPERLPWVSDVLEGGSRLPLGVRQGGLPLALDVARSPHVLLAGATNSGKGGTIRVACAGALVAGWQVVVCDPKHSGEYRWLERLGVPVLREPGEQLAALEGLEGLRERRQRVVRECGVDHWLQLPEELREGWRPVLIVLDEAGDVLVADKGLDKDRAVVVRRLGAVTLGLARKARSAGGHLLVAIQRPDVNQLGEHGGSLRNNLVARLALGRLDSDGVRMLGIPAGEPVVQGLDGTPGRGVCVGFDGDPRPSACQVAWLDQTEAGVAVRGVACSQGLDRMEPKSTELRLVG